MSGLAARRRPFIWAHRGASAVAPENTMAAFSLAQEAGADGLELDIHLSRDGVPVVLHDETLERTTDGCGPVSDLSLHQLQQLDAGGWFAERFSGARLPALVEVLATFSGVLRLNLEVKAAPAGLAIIEALVDYPAAEVLVSSFSLQVLRQLRSAAPRLPLALLLGEGSRYQPLQVAAELELNALHPRLDRVTRPLLQACRKADLPVHVWTVDDPVRVRSLARAGVAGIFTNDPALFSCAES